MRFHSNLDLTDLAFCIPRGDWVRYLWGMYAYGSDTVPNNYNELSASEVVDLWVEADPSTWDGDEGTGTTTDDPWPRMEAAADTLGATNAAINAAHDSKKGAIDH